MLGDRAGDLIGGPSVGELVAAGARVDDWVAGGALYRLVTAGVLHRGPAHLIVNATALWLLARWAMRRSPPLVVFGVWILGGFAGHLASFATAAGPSVGASGAAYALAVFASGRALRGPDVDRRAAVVLAAVMASLVTAPWLGGAVDVAAYI